MKSSTKIVAILGAFIVTTLLSCNKYLEVSPVDKFLENDVIASEQSMFKTLNGVYLNMAKRELYGGELSMRSLDIMAQYYNYNSSAKMYPLAQYNYREDYSKTIFNSVWGASYRTVLNVNSFISNVNKSGNILTEERKNIVLGEAYALRAFLHFDLLRIFGPIYALEPDTKSIPYLNMVTENIQPLLPASTVMDSILADLEKAEKLLENDPIRTEGVVQISDISDTNSFFKLRNRRLNYYAVLGIKARVLLYKGDRAGAYAAAKKVITEGGKWFPWSIADQSLPSNPNPDRVFSSEVVFGVKNYDMYSMQRDYFSMSLTSDIILAPLDNGLNSIYESNLNDYRFRINWTSGIATGKSYKTFIKYEDIADKTKGWRNLQPLLRVSELYFILAECTDDNNEALAHLNAVRKNRGLAELGGTTDIAAELEKEYYRELWGEGQLFFYLKRKNKASIARGSGGTVSMTAATYVVPLPDSEIQNRQ